MQRHQAIQIRVSPEEKGEIERLAGLAGQSVSDYLRGRGLTQVGSFNVPAVIGAGSVASYVSPVDLGPLSSKASPKSETSATLVSVPEKPALVPAPSIERVYGNFRDPNRRK